MADFIAPTSAAWDRVRNVSGFGSDPIAAPPTLPVDGVSPGGDTSSLHYYVRFTLSNGDTVTVDGNQLFALKDFSFSADQTLAIGSATTGAGAGKVTFNPLQLTFEQPGLDPQLFKMLAAGATFKEVDVLGYNVGADSSHLAVDYSFGLVAAQKMSLDDTGATRLELQYGAEEIQQFNQNPDGSFSTTPDAVGAWDRVRNVSGFGASDPIPAPLTLPAAGVPPGVGTSSLHYYVRFMKFDSTTLAVDGNQLFALKDFSFSADQTLAIGSASSGAGAGKVTFDPLSLDFSQPGLDPLLFEMLASGEVFKEVDVLGYHVGADSSHLAVDYSFGFAAAQTLGLSNAGVTRLDLQYGAEEIQQFNQHSDGSFSSTPDAVGAWDRIRNVSGFSDGTGAADPMTAPLTLPAAGVSPGGAPQLQYYVRFTQFDGSTVTVNGNQLFALNNFSFSADQILAIGSASSGAGAGKVTFNPLELNFAQSQLNPLLFQMLASGTTFKEVDVLGYGQTGSSGPGHLAVDYSFGLVGAQTLDLNPSGVTELALQYGAEEIQQFNQHSDGSFSSTPDAVGGWDRVRNVSGFSFGEGPADPIAAPLTFAPGGGSPVSGSSLHYYVRFTQFDGTTVAVDGNQLFALKGFSFSAEQTLAIGSASSGAGAGKVTFDPLSLIFGQPGFDPLLFKMLAEGKAFKEVDVLGYASAGADDTSHLAVDYSFGLVAVQTLGLDPSGTTRLDLQYGAEEIQQFNQHPDGSFSTTPDAVGRWDRVRNISGFGSGDGSADPVAAPLTLPTAGVSPGVDTSSLHYYVRFTLHDGSTVAVDGNRLFALNDFSFSADQTLAIGSASSGAGAGKVTFNPLNLSFEQPGLDPLLFKMLASGTTFKEVDVLGYNVGANSSHLAVDYSFGFAAAQTLGFDRSGVTNLDLQYGAEEIQQFNQHPDGTFSSTPDAVGGWDRIRNISGFEFGDGPADPIAAPLTLPSEGVPPGVGTSSLHYYVRFTNASGETVSVEGNQLFALKDFSFGDEQTLAIGSASSGAGAGKVTFDPLNLSFAQPGLDPLLFKMLASGEVFKEVDVLGYHVGADSSHLAVDYSFGIAAAQTLKNDLSGVTRLVLQYGQESIQFDNQAPVAVNDTNIALAGGAAAGNVLANDSDPEGDGLTVSAVAGLSGNVGTSLAGTYGHLTLNAGGSYTYAADNAVAIAAAPTGSHPHDVFSYTASDGLGGATNASLDITIDRLPVVANDANNALAGGSAAGSVLANDSDPDGDGLTVSAVAGLSGNVGTSLGGAYGHLTLNAGGTYNYAADNAAAIAAAATGTHLHDIFGYSASDGMGGAANASLDITLDRLPVATGDLAGVNIGKSVSGNVLANDRDPDGDPIQLLGLVGGSLGQGLAGKYGTLVLAGNGTYTYTSNKNAQLPSQGVGQDSFAYTESDGHGGVAQGTLNITIIPNGMNFVSGVPGATVAPGNGKSIIDASLGSQTVMAGNGADTIIGGPHDILTGGNGPDTFVFGPSSGQNTITDFDVHNDKIQFNPALFANFVASFTDVQAHTQQVGANAVITYHGADTLTLQNVTATSLHSSNFSFA